MLGDAPVKASGRKLSAAGINDSTNLAFDPNPGAIAPARLTTACKAGAANSAIIAFVEISIPAASSSWSGIPARASACVWWNGSVGSKVTSPVWTLLAKLNIGNWDVP